MLEIMITVEKTGLAEKSLVMMLEDDATFLRESKKVTVACAC
jgi:hypothetical protein